jgi:hypothetical protein
MFVNLFKIAFFLSCVSKMLICLIGPNPAQKQSYLFENIKRTSTWDYVKCYQLVNGITFVQLITVSKFFNQSDHTEHIPMVKCLYQARAMV